MDFTLPPDHGRNERVLKRARERGATGRIRLGLSGWSDRSYVGRLYPGDAKPDSFLQRYARAFPTNELNTTYYGAAPARIERWRSAVPPDFHFCPKLSKTITHDLELRGADEAMRRFVDALPAFEGRIGRVWGLLPQGFGPDRLPVLAAFLARWASEVPLAIELRHPAWFGTPAEEAVFRVFEEHGVVAVLTDVAGRRDVLHMRLPTAATMLRFVGNALDPSDFRRLDDWVERFAFWRESGLGDAHVFFHQKDEAQTVDLARHFARRFEERTGVDLLPGLGAEPAAPRQRELF